MALTKTEARMKAAQAWCTPATGNRVMDPVLCEAFANILMQAVNSPKTFIDHATWCARGIPDEPDQE